MSGARAAEPMRRAALLRSALVALLACLAGAAVVGIAYGWHGAWTTFLLLAAVAAGMLGAAHVATARRARMRLSRQLALGALLAVGTVLAAVWIGAQAMFVSDHDALVITAMAAVAAVLAVRAAQLLAQGVVRDVEAMHREVDDARRRLIAAVSHDLRTPLASLRLLVESVEDGVATGETRDRYLREMRVHVRALSVLIDDLFELSRLEAGEIAWSMHQVELSELVSETVAALRAQAEERGVAVAVELPGNGAAAGGLAVHANAEKLQRVLFNLIVNAIRHTPADGSVVVRARPGNAGLVEIEVADDGEGVAAEERERVFEPFYRGGTDGAARTGGDGAGLGLAISRAIVEAHGGRIWLEPAAPRGTRVRFTLPASSAA